MVWMCSPRLAPPELLNWPWTLLLPQGEASLLGSDDCSTITHCLRAPSPLIQFPSPGGGAQRKSGLGK